MNPERLAEIERILGLDQEPDEGPVAELIAACWVLMRERDAAKNHALGAERLGFATRAENARLREALLQAATDLDTYAWGQEMAARARRALEGHQ